MLKKAWYLECDLETRNHQHLSLYLCILSYRYMIYTYMDIYKYIYTSL